MKRTTFNYIRQILKDYSQIDEHIKKREEELRYPYKHDDINGGIKGNEQVDKMGRMLITLDQDKRLAALERNQRIISDNLDKCGEDTRVIITELYIRRYPKYTMDGLVDNRILDCGRTKAFKLRDEFFDNVADDLGLDK